MSHPVYLLTGETFLVDEALAKIRSETAADPLSESAFDASSDPAEIVTALETPSLLGDRRLVVVTDAHELRKEHLEALRRYLESPSPHAVLVLITPGRTKLSDLVKTKGAVVALQAPRGRRLIAWLRQRAGAQGLKLDERAAWALSEVVGGELRDLDIALAQLATALGAGARVGAAEVRTVFPRAADERVYAFTDAVGDRRLGIAMGALRRLLDQGEEPLMLFGALAALIRRMLVARSYRNATPSDVAEVLGVPDWRAERLYRQARSYREEELIDAMGILARTDVEMKGGDAPPEIALERAVFEIVSS